MELVDQIIAKLRAYHANTPNLFVGWISGYEGPSDGLGSSIQKDLREIITEHNKRHPKRRNYKDEKMHEIAVYFEFEIGEMLFFKNSVHLIGIRPKQYIVHERVAQECHAGIQQMYRLIGVETLVPEIALSRDEPPFRPTTQEELVDIGKAILAKRSDSWSIASKGLMAIPKTGSDKTKE